MYYASLKSNCNRTQEQTRAGSITVRDILLKHWQGVTWTNPDRSDTDNRYLSQLGSLTRPEKEDAPGELRWAQLWPVWVWKSNEKVQSRRRVSARALNFLSGGVKWVQGSFEEINATHVGSGHMSAVQLFSSLLYKYPHCGTATGWSICLNAEAHIGQVVSPASWVSAALNKSSGRSESIHTGKTLNASDLRWATSLW